MCIKTIIGENIRNMRIERNWSQAALAMASGMVTGSYIGSVERGECSIGITNLERIARGLEVKLTDVLDVDLDPLVELDEPDPQPLIDGPAFLIMVRECRNRPDAILNYLERSGIKVIR